MLRPIERASVQARGRLSRWWPPVNHTWYPCPCLVPSPPYSGFHCVACIDQEYSSKHVSRGRLISACTLDTLWLYAEQPGLASFRTKHRKGREAMSPADSPRPSQMQPSEWSQVNPRCQVPSQLTESREIVLSHHVVGGLLCSSRRRQHC